jgi:hypothetical protein
MTLRRRAAIAIALIGVVVAGARWAPDWVRAGGAPQDQRALAGGAPPTALAPTQVAPRRVRVILVDGLSRADVERVPSYAAVCARGLDVVVDIGFPTKSLPIQLALWTGLTQDQLGTPAVNLVDRAPPRGSIAVQVGGHAVVEAYRFIAATAGFTVEPDATADTEEPAVDATAARAWRDTGFAAAAERAVATDARLVLVHLLGVDEAAHHGGRSTAAYTAALAHADAIVARTLAAVPPDAVTIALADHGHLATGGHGDAEDEVRRVRACIATEIGPPASDLGPRGPERPTLGSGAEARGPRPEAPEIHLVDLSRAIADTLGVTLDPRAVGRPLAVAIAHPDRDATLRRPTGTRWSLALALAALVIAIGAYKLGRAGWVWSWPLAAYAAYRIAIGIPSLSATPRLVPVALTAAPFLALVILALRRHGRGAIAIAAAAPPAMITLVFAILSRIPDALVTGIPPRTPIWTAHVTWSAQVLAIAAIAAAVALVCPDRGRQAGQETPNSRRNRLSLQGEEKPT